MKIRDFSFDFGQGADEPEPTGPTFILGENWSEHPRLGRGKAAVLPEPGTTKDGVEACWFMPINEEHYPWPHMAKVADLVAEEKE